jgi:putative spermidine/putrescine transport system permease protein
MRPSQSSYATKVTATLPGSKLVTPRLLGGNRVSTISTVIYEKFMFSMNWPLGATLVFLLLAINFAVIMLHGRLFKEH